MNFAFAFPSNDLLGLPVWAFYAFFFFVGSLFGSFLNVVIHRVPLEKSIVFPNSACPKCGNSIKPYDNIPILSWLLLGGKCRNCKNPISARYPAVEALVGILWMIVFWHTGLTIALPFDLIFVTAIVALIFIDAENMILPDVITKPGIVFALVARFTIPFWLNEPYFDDFKIAPFTTSLDYPFWAESLIGAVIGMLAGGGSLWIINKIWLTLFGKEGMGMGDVKMMFGVGAFLGWRMALLTIFLGAFCGSIIGIFRGLYKAFSTDVNARFERLKRRKLFSGSKKPNSMRNSESNLNLSKPAFLYLFWKRKTMGKQLPYGIYLGLGAILSLLFGQELINWYLVTFVR